MKPVYSARDPVEAHLLRAVLETAGIAATVGGEFLPFDMYSALTLLVADEDVDRARTVVEGFIRRRDLTIGPD